MHWTVAAPFIDNQESCWLIPFVPGNQHQFSIIPHPAALDNWHNKASSVTSYQQWLKYLSQAKEAVHQTKGGVITVFPQLASAVGLHQQLTRKQMPIVAWLFNVGICYSGIRRWLTQASTRDISCFVVHTRRECELYSQWLGLPRERFEFVPYQSPAIEVTYEENTINPFITAIGSAHRDFPTLFEAVRKLNVPTVVASGQRALAGLVLPPQVKAPLGIGKADCLQFAQEARVNVVPLYPDKRVTAAGQVTIVEAMRMGRAIVATRCNGAEDYIIHGETGWLVEPQSVEEMTQAIDLLWNDHELRNRLGRTAQQYASNNFSDEAAGRSLGKILDQLAHF